MWLRRMGRVKRNPSCGLSDGADGFRYRSTHPTEMPYRQNGSAK